MSQFDKASPTVAIVDDDPTFQFILTNQIEKVNPAARVLPFEDGYEILEYLLQNKEAKDTLPTIIFLDLTMKRVDGWVFLQEFETIKKYLPKKIDIYIITGSEEQRDKDKATSNIHVTDYFVKPLEDITLTALLS